MSLILELPYLAAVAPLAASIIAPLIAMMFLRMNRGHSDYSWICYLNLFAAGIWMTIALLYAGDAVAALQNRLPTGFISDLFRHPFSVWSILCVPAFPVFLTILVMTFIRQRKASF